MDSSYMEVGTEVIIWTPRPSRDKYRYKGCRGVITLVEDSHWGIRCFIKGYEEYYWYSTELILASDEGLLR
jgi:hypothetical protein